jgi:hypothetical protein
VFDGHTSDQELGSGKNLSARYQSDCPLTEWIFLWCRGRLTRVSRRETLNPSELRRALLHPLYSPSVCRGRVRSFTRLLRSPPCPSGRYCPRRRSRPSTNWSLKDTPPHPVPPWRSGDPQPSAAIAVQRPAVHSTSL